MAISHFTSSDYYAKKKFMILNEPKKGKYTIEVPSQKEYEFLEHLKKCCF